MDFPLTSNVNAEFSHGSYADYWGIVFYARSTEGSWIDSLHISDTYIKRICKSVIDLYNRDNDDKIAKLLFWYHNVSEDAIEYEMAWGSPITNNAALGIDLNEDIPASIKDIEFFLAELSLLTFADLYPHAYGDTESEKTESVDGFQRCIKVINNYLSDRMARGLEIWVKDD